MVIALFLSLFLATFNEPGDMHAVIIMMFFMMLLFAIMLRVSMDSIRNWISDIKLRSCIRFDQQGLVLWYEAGERRNYSLGIYKLCRKGMQIESPGWI